MKQSHLNVIGKNNRKAKNPWKSFDFSWLATDEDDGKIVRELVPGGAAQHLDKTSYHTRIKTGDCFGAGTDANVFMKIFGEKGDSDKMQLNSSDNTKNKFERGQIDQFTHEFDDLGKVCSLRLSFFSKSHSYF